MHNSSLDTFNLQSICSSLIISQIMFTKASISSNKVKNKDHVNLNCFDETNFTHWVDQMIFILSTLNIFFVLNLHQNRFQNYKTMILRNSRQNVRKTVVSLTHFEHIISSSLQSLLTQPIDKGNMEGTEKEGSKKFLISNYFYFKMLDSKPILIKVHK